MAPTRTVRSKHAIKTSSAGSQNGITPKKGQKSVQPPPKQTKTRRTISTSRPIKRKTYTDTELGIPKLNTIVPAGVQKPKGKKKGKVFVDDAESMMTILAMVNMDKEGQIESKMMKARQMEEIRDARKKEAERKEELRRGKLEETKAALKERKRKMRDTAATSGSQNQGQSTSAKRVAFS